MKDTIFKAYDIRGIYPEEIDEQAAYLVGRAFVQFLNAKNVVVGRDMRVSSDPLHKKLIEGITCEGADVIDLGLCTTPMLSFAVANYDYDGGIMISASHNPGNYNAFKLIGPKALQIDAGSGIEEINKKVSKGFNECRQQQGAVTEKDILADYLAHILKADFEIENLKIVVDYGNGVGSISAKPALARFGIEIESLFEEPDGEFPNHPANPHDLENFNDLKKAVIQNKADIGVFFDGDADRAIFVDDLGRVVPTDLLFTLLSEKELEKDENKGQNFYFDLRFSKAVPDQIKKYGGNPVMMRVGNPVYKRALKEQGGVLAAEYSGHIMFAENYGIDDGLFAALKTLDMLKESQQKFSKLIDGVRLFETSDELSLEAKNPDAVSERLKAEFSDAKSVELDGTYLDFREGFISVRQSQTEPQLFRIRAEAKNKEELKKRLDKVIEIVNS